MAEVRKIEIESLQIIGEDYRYIIIKTGYKNQFHMIYEDGYEEMKYETISKDELLKRRFSEEIANKITDYIL